MKETNINALNRVKKKERREEKENKIINSTVKKRRRQKIYRNQFGKHARSKTVLLLLLMTSLYFEYLENFSSFF